MKTDKILFVGDVVPNSPFKLGVGIKQICIEHDLCVFNLEGSFSSLASPVPLFKAGPNLLLDKKYFAPIAENFNAATLANNHTMDYCDEGLHETITICKESGMVTTGAGSNIVEAFIPVDYDRCRIISVAEHEFGGATESGAGIAKVEEQSKIYEVIRKGKEQNKYIIIVAHGGAELISIPPPYVKKRYKLWIDFGADLIIGSHPHVPQGREIYKKKHIFYSLGNFVFPNYINYLSNSEAVDYPDYAWSIAVSIDIEQDEISVIFIRPKITNKGFEVCIDDRIQDKVRFKFLSDQIISPNYFEVYKEIVKKLYPEWYDGRLRISNNDDAAYVLHLFRCDAHRDMIQTELSRRIGEI